MSHSHAIGDSAELAALYATGAMPPAEQATFEAHLNAGCRQCAAEVRALLEVAGELGSLAAGVEPRAVTREAVLARVRTTTETTTKATPLEKHLTAALQGSQANLLTRRADENAWEDTAVPGVRIRVLNVNEAANEFVALVRMAAGASYPSHNHGGPEQCLVLDGDLRVGDEVLKPGDYQFAPEGSRHGVQTTETGCLLFITSSLNDVFE
jgi:predicted ChrR family anti-sigma factor